LGAQLGMDGSLYNMEAPHVKDPNQIDLFTKRKVGDIIFDGFDVELFKKLNANPLIGPLVGKLKESFSIMDKVSLNNIYNHFL